MTDDETTYNSRGSHDADAGSAAGSRLLEVSEEPVSKTREVVDAIVAPLIQIKVVVVTPGVEITRRRVQGGGSGGGSGGTGGLQ